MHATAKIWGPAAPQGIKLPQLIPKEVSQRGAADRAGKVWQQKVTTGTGSRREVEGVVRVVTSGFHNRREPGVLKKEIKNVNI